MIRHALLGGGTAVLAVSVLLVAGTATGQDRTIPTRTRAAPVSRQAPGPAPAELHARLARVPLPALRSAADVGAFIDAASAAPVARREEVRAIIQRAQPSAEIASRLVAEFERAQRTDFSRALVILSLIGEQRNPVGTTWLTRFIARPLPVGGIPTSESGISPEAEALERLQVKAANALPYARTDAALRSTLEVVRAHPLKAVRVEAASSYLWNAGNSAEARRTLSQVLRKDELLVLDRPVRDEGTSAEQFNRQLATYLDRHPEVRAPAPAVVGRPRRSIAERPGPPPPTEVTR